MICYRDMTFCISKCRNHNCFRKYTEEVVKGAEKTGLPICIADFGVFDGACEEYIEGTEEDSYYWKVYKGRVA